MARTVFVYENAFKGVAESDLTSNVMELRDAAGWSYSWYTTSGATSAISVDVALYNKRYDVPESAWSEAGGDSVAATAGATYLAEGPQYVSFARFRRDLSAGSIAAGIHRLILG